MSITHDQAAHILSWISPTSQRPSGDVLRKAIAKAGPGDPLYVLRQRGPARTRSGKLLEDAVRSVAREMGADERFCGSCGRAARAR